MTPEMYKTVCASTSFFNDTLLPDGMVSRQYRDWIKPLVDWALVCVLFALTLPVMILAGILVKLTSPGPVLYRQMRLGKNQQLFYIYKIRSMFHNCEAASGARWSTKSDPRITVVGRVLRKLHIDELPQFWNVLRGEMSLVGPRPERPEFARVLEQAIDGYAGRLLVKPGLTGLAQIQLPPDTDFESVRRKLALDLVYVRRSGLLLDLRLMFGTVLYLAGGTYGFVRWSLRLPQAVAIPHFRTERVQELKAQNVLIPAVIGHMAGGQPQPQMSGV